MDRGENNKAKMGRLLVDLRNGWGVQALVLFSFCLQAFLLLFAPIRRHNASTVRRLLLWVAYQLADSTALFTLGHMAISSRPLEEQPLMALWAPFLLVHLGGQDTITAYSFEDNRLWLRHLQTLVVQVLGASYVLYKYMPGSETMVMVTAVLIFGVGILKYAERIWALRSASFDSIWSSLDETDGSSREHKSNLLLWDVLERRHVMDAEMVLMAAHGLLDVCMGLFIGVRGAGRREYLREIMWSFTAYDRLDKLMEMELLLMYDVLYTKARVIHTWYGCCIRVVALSATVAALLVFHQSSGGIGNAAGHNNRNRKDVAITYVLLVGALLLEVASMVRALGSTWTCAVLFDWNWLWLLHEFQSLRRSVRASRHRRWSGFVGQYNLLQSCVHGTPAVVKVAGFLGDTLGRIAQNWWDELCESSSAQLSGSTKELVLREILRMGKRGEEIGSLPGLLTLKQLIQQSNNDDDDCIGWSIQDIGFEDSTMAWHLASEMCLFGDRSSRADLLEAIRVVSIYMMFLLVLRPYMLPGPVRRSRYDQVRGDLLHFVRAAMDAADKEDWPEWWWLHKGFHARINSDAPHAHYDAGVRLADVLYDRPDRLDLIFGVWVEMLCYVANNCSRESHARQLSMGGELVTIVWLMARHANLCYID